MALTLKQQEFVNAYLDTFNATEAARRAKYNGSDESLAMIGWENLRKLEIAEAIKRRLSERHMSSDEVAQRIADIARSDLSDFIEFKEGIKTPYINMEQAAKAGKLHLVKKLKLTSDNGIEFELHDQLAALTLLGKMHKMFTEKTEVSGPNGTPIPVKATHAIDPDTAATIFGILAAVGSLEPVASDTKADGVHTT